VKTVKKVKTVKTVKTTSIGFVPRPIEFSNNGILDSLTGAPAPKIFFDNLTREISQSRRNSQPIAIVTIKLSSENFESENEIKSNRKKAKKLSNTQIAQRDLEFEKLLALLSNNIKTNMRGSDFYSRIAENGFWLCLQGDLVQGNSTARRFEKVISEKFIKSSGKANLEFSASEWIRDQDVNQWIAEIDRQYFTN
jgi:GGDEF domain-containing protein